MVKTVKALSIIISILIAVAYFTIAERKIIGAIQRRKGPNVVGFVGLLQPLADGLKLFTKETIIPNNSSASVFMLAPTLTFFLSLINWSVIPFSNHIVLANINLGVLYLLAVSGISVYGILIAGWSSNSKYSFLGAMRSAAQLISYEISISFIVVIICSCLASLNLTIIIISQKDNWLLFSLLPITFIFCSSILAETNRHPFDLPEAEAELVAGYNVEYSAMTFALFFLGEYSNMLLMSSTTSIFFFGGWLPILSNLSLLPESIWFSMKVLLGVNFFIFTRASLPRYRYDQLMQIGWKCFLPLVISYFLLTLGITNSFQLLT
jgi:NADH-quinone oxidoreductase subunit H